MEVERTSGGLARCPLAAEGTHSTKGRFPEKAHSQRVKCTIQIKTGVKNETETEKSREWCVRCGIVFVFFFSCLSALTKAAA